MKRRNKADKLKAIETELAFLHDRDGHLTPNAVVEAAKSKGSPLHTFFEWDDSKAAAAHRIDQARDLIRSVPVNLVIEERAVQVVAYVRDPDLERDVQGYVSTASLRSDPERAKRMLDYELSRAEAYVARATNLCEAFELKSAVALLHSKLLGLRKRIRQAS